MVGSEKEILKLNLRIMNYLMISSVFEHYVYVYMYTESVRRKKKRNICRRDQVKVLKTLVGLWEIRSSNRKESVEYLHIYIS